MRHYPVFVDLDGKKVVFSGAGAHAAAKIRLLMKTGAIILVIGDNPCADVLDWYNAGRLDWKPGALDAEQVSGASLVYGANDDAALDARAAELGRAAGALSNIVDNLEGSDFLTPAIVDRDPVTVAIGTEGTAPVLARKIKAEIEALLPSNTGLLARIADSFRPLVGRLNSARLRRDFWSRYFLFDGPQAFAEGGESAVRAHLQKALHAEFDSGGSDPSRDSKPCLVKIVGAGPGDPELLTLKARRAIHEAEVVLHDQLVTPQVLELARREAVIVNVGKKGFGKSVSQEAINRLMINHAAKGSRVVRLKSGDPSVFGRLDEEIDALAEAGISFDVVPGITAASAAAADLGASLTRRNRNSSLQFITGHDINGYAEQDWAKLAKPGSTAAIYMGLKAAPWIASRLLMHGGQGNTPVTIIANVSRADQVLQSATLGSLARQASTAHLPSPAILLLGIEPRSATAALHQDYPQSLQTGVA